MRNPQFVTRLVVLLTRWQRAATEGTTELRRWFLPSAQRQNCWAAKAAEDPPGSEEVQIPRLRLGMTKRGRLGTKEDGLGGQKEDGLGLGRGRLGRQRRSAWDNTGDRSGRQTRRLRQQGGRSGQQRGRQRCRLPDMGRLDDDRTAPG